MNYKKSLIQQENTNSTSTETVELSTTNTSTTSTTTSPTTAATAAATMTTNATTTTAATTAKEKKGVGWFHSLTRRKKTPSQSSINCPNSSAQTQTSRDSHDGVVVPTNQTTDSSANNFLQQTNNNNEPLMRSCNNENLDLISSAATGAGADAPSCSGTSSSNNSARKRKEEKNAFQRFRKRMGLRFPSLRRHKHSSIDGATTDASCEFLTHSPIHEPLHFNFKRSTSSNCATTGLSTDDSDMVPFTHDFKRFIRKKWLEREDGPNLIMYEASCEMLK